MKPDSTEALVQWMLAKEEELSLLARACLGVGVWEAFRVNTYYALARRSGLLDEQADTARPASGRGAPTLAELRREMPRRESGPTDYLLVGSRLRHEVDGEPVDLYTQAFRRRAQREGKRVFELPLQPRSQRTGQERENFDYALRQAILWSRKPAVLAWARWRLRRTFRDFLRHAQDELGVPSDDLLSVWAPLLLRFHVLRFFALRLLAAKGPSEVITVTAYGLPWLVAAARRRGIPVVELQHGVISAFHLGYHYPGARARQLRYFPDRLVLWSGFWRHMAALPLPDERIAYLPLQALEDLKSNRARSERRPEVLVISQATLGERLAAFLKDHLPGDFPFLVRFRLHPRERNKWTSYAALAELVRSKRVVLDADGAIYPRLLSSAAVIGCYSTALYEAAELGCKVFVAPLPGSEQMRALIERKHAVLLDRPAAWVELSQAMRR